MVHCYPYMISLEPFIHSLAAETGQPLKEDIFAAAQTDHMVAEWRQFSEYGKFVATEVFHEYVPFLKREPAALGFGTGQIGPSAGGSSAENSYYVDW